MHQPEDRGALGVTGSVGQVGSRLVMEWAERQKLPVVRDGDLTLAAPAGMLHTASGGDLRIWLAGYVVESPAGPEAGARPPAVEAVAAGLAQAGDRYARRLVGAYLLVVHDRRSGAVTVFHDHLGARTLHYVSSGGGGMFAEHSRDLLACTPSTPSPDRTALVQWIGTRTLPVGSSLFSGIRRLAGGRALEVSLRGVAERAVWRPEYRGPSTAADGQTVAAAAFAAVGRATTGLARPAVRLSGGLDSACVAAGLRHIGVSNSLALARTFPEHPAADESDLIRQTAAATGAELVQLPYRGVPLLAAIRAYIERWALPPGSPNLTVWPPLLAEARARTVDGLLDGEGGDELFGEWPYLIADDLRHGRLLRAWSLSGRISRIGERPGRRLRLRVLRRYGLAPLVPLAIQRRRWRRHPDRSPAALLVPPRDLPALLAQHESWREAPAGEPLWWRAAVDALVNGPERLDANGHLRREAVDGGLELRHPFLHDPVLLETMLACPPEAQFQGHRDRPLLRDGLTGHIPESVRVRYSKSYFNEVSARMLEGPDGATLLEQLRSPDAPIREFVRPEALDALTPPSAAAGLQRYQMASRLFRLGSANLWLRSLAGIT